MAQPGLGRVGTTGPGRAATALWARTRQGLGMRRRLSGRVHDKAWARTRQGTACTIVGLCRDKDFSIAIDLSSSQKKKKKPSGIGASHLGIRT